LSYIFATIMTDAPAIFTRFEKITQPILNFIFPPICVICEERLIQNEKLVCNRCWEKLPLKKGEKTVTPPVFSTNPAVVDGFRAVYKYSNEFQKIILEMKYFRKKSIAKRLGNEMSALVFSDPEYKKADYLVPVPLHKLKFRERGYNQSKLLAESIANMTGISVNDRLLKRVVYTQAQAKLNASQRMQNVRSAFRLAESNGLDGSVVILIDDVLTTGSTLFECAKLLKTAGVAKVLTLTAAQAL